MPTIITGETGVNQITDGVITANDLASGSVTTAKIGDANITQAKLAAGVVGNGPAFSAYFNGSQTLTSSYTPYKITVETEQWDTASCYDSATNYRFTPNVAGYYQVNAGVSITTGSNTIRSMLYKNGSLYCGGIPISNSSLGRIPSMISLIVYLNGSTDYIELYADSPSAGQTIAAYSIDNKLNTYFQAAMVRAA